MPNFPSSKPEASVSGETSQYIQGRIAWADQQNALVLKQWGGNKLMPAPHKTLVDPNTGDYSIGAFTQDELLSVTPPPPPPPAPAKNLGTFSTGDATGQILSQLFAMTKKLDTILEKLGN